MKIKFKKFSDNQLDQILIIDIENVYSLQEIEQNFGYNVKNYFI
ncbi:MAG: hypothetical protein WCZ11_02985 [Bacilli bacterium]